MSRLASFRRGLALAAVVALSGAAAAQAGGGDYDPPDRMDRDRGRLMFATTDAGLLLQFDAARPGKVLDAQPVTGLPSGVKLRGIDFRPATGDLYGVGSDSVVYRVNPFTAIAVAEGPAFTPALRGTSFGIGFNPTVDLIRSVSDARQNLALNVDPGQVMAAGGDLNPAMPRVTAADYTNSSFSATRPASTTLYVIDSGSDRLFVQNPPAAGTLTMPKPLGIDVADTNGFDIAGAENQGYLATAMSRGRGTGLYTVDLATGDTELVGRIGGGRRTVITGLAAWQD
jgi:hypothetical protein